ncbi:MAG: hypothetical protein CMM07_17975 [Rhodopirellula sp.]|nr:hypothetical protein [Rhodopirellula sp.]
MRSPKIQHLQSNDNCLPEILCAIYFLVRRLQLLAYRKGKAAYYSDSSIVVVFKVRPERGNFANLPILIYVCVRGDDWRVCVPASRFFMAKTTLPFH